MPRCELTGKGPVVKNKVSHSNIKTKGIAKPNIQPKRMFSEALQGMVQFKMATSTLRRIDQRGGIDAFILKQPDDLLSKRALTVKNRILRKLNRKPSKKA